MVFISVLFSWLTRTSLLACSMRSDGGERVLKLSVGKTRGKSLPSFFFPRLFFARAGTSYESVNKPFKVHIVVQCYFLFRDIVFCDYEIRGSARVSRPRSSTYEVQPKN